MKSFIQQPQLNNQVMQSHYLITIIFFLTTTLTNAQQILDSGLNIRTFQSTNIYTDSLLKEDYKTYMYVSENDSTFTYSLDALIENNKIRKIYITVTKSGFLKNIYVSENKFDFYTWKFNQTANKIEDFEYNFFE